MSGNKIVSRKIVISVGIICLILIVGLISVALYYTQVVKEKDDTIASLNAQIVNKDHTISSIQEQLNAKDSELSSLNSQVSDLQNQVSSLQEERDNLSSQVTSLNTQILNLSSQISNLQSQLTSLQSENENLKKITKLEMVSYLDTNRPINIPANSGSPGFAYLVPYAGIITISFSATSGVYFMVYIYYNESFFPQVNITYRFPEQGTFTEGIFSFPVLPGFASFQIVNPSSIGVSVLITVKYTY